MILKLEGASRITGNPTVAYHDGVTDLALTDGKVKWASGPEPLRTISEGANWTLYTDHFERIDGGTA